MYNCPYYDHHDHHMTLTHADLCNNLHSSGKDFWYVAWRFVQLAKRTSVKALMNPGQTSQHSSHSSSSQKCCAGHSSSSNLFRLCLHGPLCLYRGKLLCYTVQRHLECFYPLWQQICRKQKMSKGSPQTLTVWKETKVKGKHKQKNTTWKQLHVFIVLVLVVFV